MKPLSTDQFGLNQLQLADTPQWVKFDYDRLRDLQKRGYQYFVFVVENEVRKIYPFKTYDNAIDKKLENSHLDIQDNYIMCDDYALVEIAKGNTISDVLVQLMNED